MRYGRISSSTVSTFSSVSVSNASLSSSPSMSAMPGVAKGDSMSVDDIRMALPRDGAHPLPVEEGAWNDDFEQHAPEDERAAGLKGEKEGGTKAVAGDAWSAVVAATHPPTKDALLIIPTIVFVTCCGDID